MTQRLNGLDLQTQLIQLEVFDSVTGHIDPIATAEATRFVLHNDNTVRLSNGSVDITATLVKRKAAKAAFLTLR